MLKHSPIFWLAILASLAAGVYGIISGRGVIAMPYLLINPAVYFFFTSWQKLAPVKRQLEVIGALVFFLTIPGSVYLHSTGIQYDIILHFFSSFLAFQAFYLVLPIVFNNPRLTKTTAAFITIAGGLAFEGLQKASDVLFGTQLFFDVVQPIQLDFAIDILTDILGAAVGVIYLKFVPPSKEA